MQNEPGALNPMLTVSPSPHVKRSDTSRSLMFDVIIALTPALVWSVFVFGFRTLSIAAVSILSCVLFEILTRLVLRRNVNTVFDLSAVVTGLLLALNLPATVPLWLPILGAFFAITIVKQLYGGIGKNIVNPAVAARIFLFCSWPGEMTAFPAPFRWLDPFTVSLTQYDAVAGSTVLQTLKNGSLPSITLFEMFLGERSGVIGEISAMLLILGGLYLICRKTITWHIPVAYLGTVALLTAFFPQLSLASDVMSFKYMAYELMGGGLLLGAIFMATDYSTSPTTNTGRLIYGVGCGALTVFIRYFGSYPEGTSFAIMIMNLLVWYLDRFTRPRIFGAPSRKENPVKKTNPAEGGSPK